MWEGLSVISFKTGQQKVCIEVIGFKRCCRDLEEFLFACFLGLLHDDFACTVDDNVLKVGLAALRTMIKPKVE